MCSKHFYDYCWHFNQSMMLLFLFIPRFRFSNFGQWGRRKAIFCKRRCFIPLVCQSNWNVHPNACISQLLCYSSSSWLKLGVSACVELEIFVVKLGSTCESKLIWMKKGISTSNCQKCCQRPTEIFLFSKYHCVTLTVDLELDVFGCAQFKILPTKTASHGLILQKLCIPGPITCHRLTLKGKYFCITGKSSRKS